MTEADWRATGDPWKLFRALSELPSPRKLILFGSACCRRVLRILGDPTCDSTVDSAERFTDGEATIAELQSCRESVARADRGGMSSSQRQIVFAVRALIALSTDLNAVFSVSHGSLRGAHRRAERPARGRPLFLR